MSTVTCPACRATVDVSVRSRDGAVLCGGCGREFTPPDAAAAAPPPEPKRQYPVLPFKPPRGGAPFRVSVAAGFGIVGALAFGVGAALLREHLWLVLIFPFLHGLLVGLPAGLGARLAKARRPGLLAVVAAGCGVLSYVVVHYLFYLGFLANPNAPAVGFLEFMDLRAEEGVRFGKAGAGGGGTNLGYVGTVIYWAVEAIATAAGAAITAVLLIESPFCEGCNRWKAKRQFGPYAVDPTFAVPAVGGGVPAGLLVPADKSMQVALTVYSCAACGDAGTADVKVHGTHKVGSNMMNWNAFVTYPGEALPEFDRLDLTLRELGLGGKK